jgi:hypothetical protein
VVASLCPPATLYDPYFENEISPEHVNLVRQISMESAVKSPCYKDGYWARMYTVKRILIILEMET